MPSKPSQPEPVPANADAATESPARGRGPRPGDTVRNPLGFGRETIESIVVAFTLALLFRAFEAEAFVIPTGSMAPTLMGRHKDLLCESCRMPYRVGCSAEADDPTRIVPASKCPNCGLVMDLVRRRGGGVEYDPRYPSFSGDRILVNKFAYDIAEPRRWDVVVFRYPEDAKTNYIKRLIGLPGETVTIAGGDVWIARDGGTPRIARKPLATMQAMLQCVHDSRHVSQNLLEAGWPTAWTDWSAADRGQAGWRSDDGGRSFSVDTTASGGSATLRFRNMLPSIEQWSAVKAGEPLIGAVKGKLITDVQPYNTQPAKPHWVRDIAIEAVVESRGETGTVIFELVDGGGRHRCEFDLKTGGAILTPAGRDGGDQPLASTAVFGTGSWKILFANVDDELAVFVDGLPVAFSRRVTWDEPIDASIGMEPSEIPVEPGDSTPSDLSPVGITVAEANVRVGDLRVLRDVHYLAIESGSRSGEFAERPRIDFPLESGQYFVLGDNSAASKDSRLWNDGHHVDRHLLIGKAMLVFWPHAVPASWAVPVKIAGVELRLPSWPNFARMRFVR
ncbi:MAG: signal peptidase I [Planctomycetia bacterium]